MRSSTPALPAHPAARQKQAAHMTQIISITIAQELIDIVSQAGKPASLESLMHHGDTRKPFNEVYI
jgi:hypothetical protein